MSAYVLSGVTITGPRGPVLNGLELTVPDRAVTVILGPAGTGKSALLRALSGLPAAPGWRISGALAHRGATPAPGDIAWCRQRRPRDERRREGHAHWRDALGSGAATVLLDEPTRYVADSDAGALIAAVRAHAGTGAAVVVTHDLSLARRLADEVILLVDGRLHARGPAASFFTRPPSDLARRFLEQGNCWPGPRVPEPPSHLRWVIPGRLAGMARPGLLGDLDQELEAIASAGVTTLVSLEEIPLAAERLRSVGIGGRHLPIRDMDVPRLGPAMRLCADLSRAIDRGDGVGLHCRAGLGRTGMMLAAILVWRGADADQAIGAVRAVRGRYIQNEAQLLFVRRLAEALR